MHALYRYAHILCCKYIMLLWSMHKQTVKLPCRFRCFFLDCDYTQCLFLHIMSNDHKSCTINFRAQAFACVYPHYFIIPFLEVWRNSGTCGLLLYETRWTGSSNTMDGQYFCEFWKIIINLTTWFQNFMARALQHVPSWNFSYIQRVSHSVINLQIGWVDQQNNCNDSEIVKDHCQDEDASLACVIWNRMKYKC